MVYATLYLLNYNNYYNRIVKKEDTLSGYLPYLIGSPIERVNFIPGDYVNTTQIVNWNNEHPNYMLVVDEDGSIESRWFVVNTTRLRGGQLQLQLYRDTIADFYDNLLDENTSIFVEKAIIPESNNLIFNSENMTFNEIKIKETLLKDDTQCPWIVLYGARKDGEGNSTTFSSKFITQYPYTELSDQEYENLVAHAEGTTVSDNYKPIYANPVATQVNVIEALNGKSRADYYVLSTLYDTPQKSNSPFAMETGASFTSNAATVLQNAMSSVLDSVGSVASSYNNSINPTLYNYILLNQGKYLKHGSQYYKINLRASSVNDSVSPTSYTGSLSTALQPLRSAFSNPNQVVLGSTVLNSNIQVLYTCSYVRYSLEEVSAPVTEGNGDVVTITSNRYHLVDAPYDMFCMPLSDTLFITNSKKSGFKKVKCNRALALSMANQLIADYSGTGQIYDGQILPYCPIQSHQMTTDTEGNLVYDIFDDSLNAYSLIQASQGMSVIGYVLHATQSSFSTQIQLEEPIIIQNYKVESECDMYRLNSPNYGSSFEFNAAKNGGVSYFNVVCTYKPYSPYIKIYPNWGRLYGEDFNDARGLICGGDFSLPTLTDQWKTYELQNKNYQASFDRQIQNLELTNSVQREQDIWNIVSGTLGGGAQGAGAGVLAANALGGGGGALGALAGIPTAALSLAGGIRDLQLNDKLRKEAIDYTKDQFGYQLGNIRALPNTLSRTSAYNIDNKYFPFLEYYTCSEVEKQALRDKIKYNGMTVMAIGNMIEYINNYNGTDLMYFKGKLIRLENFNDDYNLLNTLGSELNKGVFI